MNNSTFKTFLRKLQKTKSPQEFQRFLTNLLNFSATELYVAILFHLTKKDVQAIEKITDESQALEEMARRFKLRTKLTPSQYINQLKKFIAKSNTKQTSLNSTVF